MGDFEKKVLAAHQELAHPVKAWRLYLSAGDEVAARLAPRDAGSIFSLRAGTLQYSNLPIIRGNTSMFEVLDDDGRVERTVHIV